MSDDEKIVEGFKTWLEEQDDPKAEKLKKSCVLGFISLQELIDALRKNEIEMTRRYLKCQRKLS